MPKFCQEHYDYIKKTIEDGIDKGLTNKEIAVILNMTPTNINNWKRKLKIKRTRLYRPPLPGEVFGKWTFVEEIYKICKSNRGTISNRKMWRCQCECGNICDLRITALLSEDSRYKKEGCVDCRNPFLSYKQWKGYGEISSTYWHSIIKRDKEINITIEYIWDLFLKQNRKCALSGIKLTFAPVRKNTTEGNKAYSSLQTASLDRIDSKKGYIKGNVRWIHKDINNMRQDYTDEEFIDYIKLIYTYQKDVVGNI